MASVLDNEHAGSLKPEAAAVRSISEAKAHAHHKHFTSNFATAGDAVVRLPPAQHLDASIKLVIGSRSSNDHAIRGF